MSLKSLDGGITLDLDKGVEIDAEKLFGVTDLALEKEKENVSADMINTPIKPLNLLDILHQKKFTGNHISSFKPFLSSDSSIKYGVTKD